MPKLNLIRRLSPHTWLKVVGVVAALALLLSLFLQRDDFTAWLVDALLNAAFLALGLFAGIWIAERWLEQEEQHRWSNVELAIHGRAVRAALAAFGGFAAAPTIEAQVRFSSPDIPTYGQLVSDPSLALDFCKNHLAPVVSGFTSRTPPRMTSDFVGFSDRDWLLISQGIERSLLHTARTVVLIGERPTPMLQVAIIALEDSTTRYVDLHSSRNDRRSGHGEMAYQKALLGCMDEVVKAAIAVLEEWAAITRPATT